MKHYLIYLSVLIAAGAQAGWSEAEGDRVGNGGFAYVCRDSAKKITYAQLLDLWEAEELKTYRKDTPVEEQIAAAIKKLKHVSPNAGSFIAHNMQKLRASMVYVNRSLAPTEDAFPPYLPSQNCAYEQVARYEPVLTETGKRGLRINREIYESPHFTNSDRAALFVHEGVYYTDRLYNGSTNSQRTRTVVAHLFSDSVMPNAIRLTFAATLGLKHSEEDGGSKKQFLALKDPSEAKVTVTFQSVDNIDYEGADRATNRGLYQCQIVDLAGARQAKTGWVPLNKIVGSTKIPDSNQNRWGFPVAGKITISEFRADHEELPDGMGNGNSVMLECEHRKGTAKPTPVAFEAKIEFDETAECLLVEDDGSIITSKGDWCRISAKREATSKYPFVAPTIEIVRGL